MQTGSGAAWYTHYSLRCVNGCRAEWGEERKAATKKQKSAISLSPASSFAIPCAVVVLHNLLDILQLAVAGFSISITLTMKNILALSQYLFRRLPMSCAQRSHFSFWFLCPATFSFSCARFSPDFPFRFLWRQRPPPFHSTAAVLYRHFELRAEMLLVRLFLTIKQILWRHVRHKTALCKAHREREKKLRALQFTRCSIFLSVMVRIFGSHTHTHTQ